MIKFPYYSGNIKNSTVIGHITLEQFINSHNNPTAATIEAIKNINHFSEIGDVESKRLFKHKLYAFTPSVVIPIGEKRRYSNVVAFTGLMQIDLDKIPSTSKAIDLKEHIFHEHEEIVCAYLSPSGLGVKALMKIDIEDIDSKTGSLNWVENRMFKFRALHKAITTEFAQYEYFDEATKNAVLPLFLSSDEDILYRSFEDAKSWTKLDWSKPKYVSLNEAPKPRKIDDRQATWDYEKVVRIITDRINQISGDGHPQVRNTALVLGSRVAAGYITRNEAEHLIEGLIKNNKYLSKGTAGYVKTAMWGIKEGSKQPKYF